LSSANNIILPTNPVTQKLTSPKTDQQCGVELVELLNSFFSKSACIGLSTGLGILAQGVFNDTETGSYKFLSSTQVLDICENNCRESSRDSFSSLLQCFDEPELTDDERFLRNFVALADYACYKVPTYGADPPDCFTRYYDFFAPTSKDFLNPTQVDCDTLSALKCCTKSTGNLLVTQEVSVFNVSLNSNFLNATSLATMLSKCPACGGECSLLDTPACQLPAVQVSTTTASWVIKNGLVSDYTQSQSQAGYIEAVEKDFALALRNAGSTLGRPYFWVNDISSTTFNGTEMVQVDFEIYSENVTATQLQQTFTAALNSSVSLTSLSTFMQSDGRDPVRSVSIQVEPTASNIAFGLYTVPSAGWLTMIPTGKLALWLLSATVLLCTAHAHVLFDF
jgi:hypothetical protein